MIHSISETTTTTYSKKMDTDKQRNPISFPREEIRRFDFSEVRVLRCQMPHLTRLFQNAVS